MTIIRFMLRIIIWHTTDNNCTCCMILFTIDNQLLVLHCIYNFFCYVNNGEEWVSIVVIITGQICLNINTNVQML